MIPQKSASPTISQLKRTLHSSTPHDQPIDAQSSIQQLISRIQSTILQTSESMKQRLSSFQQHQLINYKNDLLKTQQQFIKIRAQRNQDAIKTRMVKEKALVQQKFNTQIRKSMEMNAKYEKMKGLVKAMNQDERQLIMEINYVKKKIDKETKDGQKLEDEIREIQRGNNNNSERIQSNKRVSKVDQERKLFKELVNKCQHSESNNANKTKQSSDDSLKPSIAVENYSKKMERRLKYQISNLKDYIDNIPLQLNFVQNTLYSSIKQKFEKAKLQIKEQMLEEEEDKENNEEKDKENKQGEEVKDSDCSNQDDKQNEKKEEQVGELISKNTSSVKHKKLIKLPSITPVNLLSIQPSMKPNNTKQNPNKTKQNPNNTKQNPNKQPKPLTKSTKPIQPRSKLVQKENLTKQSQQILNIQQLPKSSALLQEILLEPEVKEYLYRILFEGGGVVEE